MHIQWTKSLAAHARGTAVVCAVALALTAGQAAAQGTEFIMKGYEDTATPEHEWKDHPAIPPGAKLVLIYGDPKQEGPYIFRVKFPAGYKLPAHKHQDGRIVTVLQGNYWSGVGEKFEQSKLTKFTPGSFYTTEPTYRISPGPRPTSSSRKWDLPDQAAHRIRQQGRRSAQELGLARK